MSDFDIGSVTYTAGPAQRPEDNTQRQAELKFAAFLRDFSQNNTFIYRYRRFSIRVCMANLLGWRGVDRRWRVRCWFRNILWLSI